MLTFTSGRLLYTTGDVSGAVKLFLGLLKDAAAFSSSGLPVLGDGTLKGPGNDKLYLDDFRVAYNVLLFPCVFYTSTHFGSVLEVHRSRAGVYC